MFSLNANGHGPEIEATFEHAGKGVIDIFGNFVRINYWNLLI